MMIIVVSDIFGRTPALEELCSYLPDRVEIIDPYNGKFFQFKDESEAYFHFSEYVGSNCYSKILKNKTDNISNVSILVGFSIGASAIWEISDQNLENVSSAICFYGSQIRHSVDIIPTIPMRIVLPKSEEHFSVEDLSLKLKQKQNVKVHQTEFFHGFMNFYSKNYNDVAYKHYIKWLISKIT